MEGHCRESSHPPAPSCFPPGAGMCLAAMALALLRIRAARRGLPSSTGLSQPAGARPFFLHFVVSRRLVSFERCAAGRARRPPTAARWGPGRGERGRAPPGRGLRARSAGSGARGSRAGTTRPVSPAGTEGAERARGFSRPCRGLTAGPDGRCRRPAPPPPDPSAPRSAPSAPLALFGSNRPSQRRPGPASAARTGRAHPARRDPRRSPSLLAMSLKQAAAAAQPAGNNRKPPGGGGPGLPSAAGRQNMGRGRSSGKGPPQPTISFDGIYANMRMVHILTSVVGSKCEVQVKNGGIYEGVFKTYSPKCDLVVDAAHRKTAESSLGPKREDILESILFKSSDFVMVHFKDMDTNYARRDAFTDSAISAKVNGEHKEKDLEPWDGGENTASEELEALETDVSNGWDPNDMFRYNEENYGVVSTYDSSLSSYTVPLERDNSEEFLKREARATQLAEEIESSAQYKARVALENDERTEEEKYTAVQRNANEREGHGVNTRENKYIPPGQRNRDVLSWGSGRQNSPRMGQSGSGPPISRSGSHTSEFSPNSGADQRVVNGGPPRMSPKAQRHPRGHRVSTGRGTISSGLEFVSHNAPGEASTAAVARGSPSGGTWSSVVSGVPRLSPKTHRPRSPRQSSTPMGPALPSPQPGTIPTESVAMPVPAASPTPASPASNRAVTPSNEAKDTRLQDQRQNSATGNKENIKPSETSPSFSKPENKGVSPIVSEHRKQIDDLKKFKNDFRLQSSSSSDAVDQLLNKTREGEKSRDVVKEKTESTPKESIIEAGSNTNSSGGSSKPNSPSISPSMSNSSEQKRGPEVTSQGVQTSGPGNKQDKEDKEEKKDTSEQVRKSTLNPNAKEFNPRSFAQPKPSTTPTSPRPQAQPSPSMVGHQQPTPVYTQPVCFAPNMMYPVPVSPGVQPLYPIPMTPMPVNQAKTYRAGKVPNMPQQRQDQHHQSTMMHPASAAGPPIVATPPAYSTQYVAYSPQQFPNQPLVQHVPHYQSQHPHVYSPVIQGNARMMAPPAHAQPGLVSSSATQYGAHEQTHAMYVSTGSLAQQYAHPNATLHPHPPHPQPSATPTGQQQSQHAGSHPAPSPVQHHQHQAAQALHLANPQQQSAIYHAGLAPTPPSMTPGSNTQSPQNNFPTAQQTVFTIHPSHVQPAYTNPPHMAHVPQAHVQSGMVPSHPTAHAPMMLMTTQPPGGPQAALAQSALQPIPVSTTTHFPYMTHPSGEECVPGRPAP
ncbi:ataxin-2 isoform X10 [Onychostruthus taczanowskii]|uniref:ataxin-2 isoform X10 n=2 Tax=Passeridae TaxID=9158 RepID=UPI001B808E37|nr:ataxin-2 isoform X10 [Onychostruthus taczanowskii]